MIKTTFDTKTMTAEAVAIFLPEGGTLTAAGQSIDKKLNNAVKRAMKAEEFKGKKGSALMLPGTPAVIVLGLGKTKDLTTVDFQKLGHTLMAKLKGYKIGSVNVQFDIKGLPGDCSLEKAAVTMAESLVLNSYRFNKYFTKKVKEKKLKLKTQIFTLKEAGKAKTLFNKRQKVLEGNFLTRDLVSEAPNILYPESFVTIIKKELTPLGVKVRILDEKEMKKLGMGAFIAVGQGSVRPPRLAIMEYKNGKTGKKPIAFVGKGITFDTGGISLKPGAGMQDMKWDMGGAGVVTGLMKALAGRKAKVNVIGIVALAENMPDGKASRPGDVVKTMSGQTVEILNTDAEGRLVLCDTLWYVQEKYKPTHIVDLATLTGAILVALGHEYAGMFSNDDKLAEQLLAAGIETGEDLWRMPLNKNYNKELDSQIADMQNIGSRNAGSATAAHFLGRFIQKGVKWAHLDIAGMAWAYRDKTLTPKGASGYGVRLLDQYVADYWE